MSTLISSGDMYYPLYAFLTASPPEVECWLLSFAQVEQIIGVPLPASASTHQAWWGNDATSHVQAKAWLLAGWRTDEVAGHRPRQQVLFVREELR